MAPLIPVYEPLVSPYISPAIDALQSGWISNYGKYIHLANDKLREILGVKYCILMSNGTLATECLLLALKFKHPEVTDLYIADHLFISPYNCAARHFDHSHIHVLPVDPQTLNMDLHQLDQIKPNSCLLVVHSLSNIVNVEKISRLRPDLIIIEDNCEGFMGEYEGKKTGSSSGTLCSSISFYANKNITSGEGGAFLTNDEEVYKHILKVYSHGMTSTRYIHDVDAWNFRMTNIQAALLWAQLEDINYIIDLKRQVFIRYNELLTSVEKIEPIVIAEECKSSYWMYVVKVQTDKTYQEIEDGMKAAGIEIRPMFYSVKCHPHLSKFEVDSLALQQAIKDVVLILPSSPTLDLVSQQRVVQTLTELV